MNRGKDTPPPPLRRSRVNGYELDPLGFGFDIRLTYGYSDGSTSIVASEPAWALTRRGAHRRARRMVARERRREDREQRVTRWPA